MTERKADVLTLPDDRRRLLESWLLEFDRSWTPNRLAERVGSLPPQGDTLRRAALIELVKMDLHRQWQHGRQIGVESYLGSFPELGTADTAPTELLEAEYEARRQSGGMANLADFSHRFPRQADALRQLLEVEAATLSPASTANGQPLPTVGAPSLPPELPTAEDLPEHFGRYRILRKLGQGGMGAVYLAHDCQLDRQVALKVPRFTADDGPEALERFHREARAAATLSHPNVCPVHDVGQLGGVHYLTMAYIDGRPLSEAVPKGEAPQRHVAALVRQLALALEEAHAHGVIHRDLKPANVMINRRGEPVVMDFGLARRSGAADVRLTRSGAIMGTPAYMSPEQVEGHSDIGPATDVYSLGVILYEQLAGRLPFEGNTPRLLAQILDAEPPPLASLRPDVDPKLAVICHKAMAKKPADRYARMADFAAALDAYLRLPGAQGATVREAPAPAAGRRKTRPVVWVAAAVAAVAAVVVGVVLYVNSARGRIRIEINENNAVVSVDGENVRIDKLGTPIMLTPGKHGLVVKRADVIVETRKFTVTRGDNPVLKITLPEPGGQTEPGPTARQGEPGEAAPDQGFTPLFNGKDLDGWVQVGGEGRWAEVEEGAIKITGGGPTPQEWLMTEKAYADFVLRFEFKFAPGANSGLTFRAPPAPGFHLEVQLRDESVDFRDAPTGGLYWRKDYGTRLSPDQRAPLKAVGSWNEMEVEARGPSLRVSVNGQAVLQTQFDTLADRQGAAEELNRTAGRIGFQRWLGTVWVRNVRVKDLAAAPRPRTGEPGFTALFNGKDLTGWVVDSGDPQAWQARNGELKAAGSPDRHNRGWLLTQKDYANFILRLEFLLTPAANSGVCVRARRGETDTKNLEIQILDDPRYPGEPDNRLTGSLWSMAIDRRALLEPLGSWNRMEIEARGRSLRVRVNGRETVNTDLDRFAHRAEDIPALNRVSGRIGLQNWEGAVCFRNIEVKELP